MQNARTKAGQSVMKLSGAAIWVLHVPLFLALWGCQVRQVPITVPMRWSCEPEPKGFEDPGAQLVRLTFIRNPNYFFYLSGLSLCDRLKALKKREVTVSMEVFTRYSGEVSGFHDIAIEGKRVIIVGGWGTGESVSCAPMVPCGSDPLQDAVDGHSAAKARVAAQ